MTRTTAHTGAIAERYHRDGFHFPLDVLSKEQALACRVELERPEPRVSSSFVRVRLPAGDTLWAFA